MQCILILRKDSLFIESPFLMILIGGLIIMKYDDILSHLSGYKDEGVVPMHMPGAKRNKQMIKEYMNDATNPYEMDITEIDGFDNMHNAEEIIKDAFEQTARLYGADESLFLVNGSTAGNMAAICGVTNKGDKVIVARNCHISVYNAIILNELQPTYIYPEYNLQYGFFEGITLQEIKSVVENNKEKCNYSAVIITSPTYEGNVSQISEIAQYLHNYNIPLIVDEAHGAHFKFSKAFPKTAVECGADIVINSVHKTLPSLTQTAVMHINYGYVNVEKVKRYWNIYQSTSPSYILMGSIHRCMSIIENAGEKIFKYYVIRLNKLRENLKKLNNIKLIETDDISKIVLGVDNAKDLYNTLLEKYKIQLEMSSLKYVIAMTSVFDSDEYYKRFYTALYEIDKEISEEVKIFSEEEVSKEVEIFNGKEIVEKVKSFNGKKVGKDVKVLNDEEEVCKNVKIGNNDLEENANTNKSDYDFKEISKESNGDILDFGNKNDVNEVEEINIENKINIENICAMSISEALHLKDENGCDEIGMNSGELYGRISSEMVYVYPPGIPILCPGEVITQQIADRVKAAIGAGLDVVGVKVRENESEGVFLCLK